MFCNQCGTATAEGTKFCGNCGTTLQAPLPPSTLIAPVVTPPPIPMAEADVVKVRPWVRYWARMFDIYLAAIVGGLAIGFLNPDAFNEKGSDQLFGIVVIFVWVFVE